jgi:hypothetical protein
MRIVRRRYALSAFLLIAVLAIALFQARPATTPDMELTFVDCVEAGKTNGLFRTREATFEVFNRGDRRVQLDSITIEQRGNGLPEDFNSTVARRTTPTTLRSGERQAVHVRFTTLADGLPSGFRARCVVIPGASWSRTLDRLRNQTWSMFFPQKQKQPAVTSYGFSSAWTDD